MSVVIPDAPYPATLSVDFPEEARNKLTVGLRFLWVIPIAIVLGTIGSANAPFGDTDSQSLLIAGGGVLFFPTLLMIVFRTKYPKWWYEFNLNYTRFAFRVGAYGALLTDRYPSTDDEQSIHLDFPYPEAQSELNRWLPLVKWLLAVPHFIVLFFLGIAAFFVSIYAWLMILLTGKHPQGAFDFVVGFLRWWLRVDAYALLLVTDRYPPFRLGP